jgi:hypothetical protein
MMTVKAMQGHYLVIVVTSEGLKTFAITKNQDGQVECTCGVKNCSHMHAVAAYNKAGGAPPAKATPQEVARKLGLTRCPICGAQLLKAPANTWNCADKGGVHYFEWLDKEVHQGKVRKWMTGEGKRRWLALLPETGSGTENAEDATKS